MNTTDPNPNPYPVERPETAAAVLREEQLGRGARIARGDLADFFDGLRDVEGDR